MKRLYCSKGRRWLRFRRYKARAGFTMLEAVVTVGVLLAIAVGGFFAYGPIVKNAKTAKVRSVASEVYTAAMVSHIDGDSTTSAADVISQYNDSNKDIRVSLRIAKPDATIAAMVTDSETPVSGDDFCVTATMIKQEDIFAEAGLCPKIPEATSPSETTPPVEPSIAPEVPYVDPHPNLFRLTYQCDVTTSIKHPIQTSNATYSGTITWNDEPKKNLIYDSKSLIGGVQYTASIEGTFSHINSSYTPGAQAGAKCLRSIEHWGSATGTIKADKAFQGAINLTAIPSHVPNSISSMTYMFDGATSLNDPNIKGWDVSNTKTMAYMFNNATSFNQDLSSWSTLRLTDLSYMFNGATSMNSPLNGWNTSAVTNMDHMFFGASSFNQPLDKWNTSQVSNMWMMFFNAPYSQSLTSWDMNKVGRMGMMLNNPDSSQLPRTTHPNMFRLTYQCDTTTLIKIPITSVNADVSGSLTWNDGTASIGVFGSYGSKYLTAGTKYTVIFEGTFTELDSRPSAENIAGAKCIRSVDYWGSSTGTIQADGAFKGAINLTNVPASIPTSIRSASYMFDGATSLSDPNMKTWNVSNIQNMSYMFNNALAFNQDLSKWSTSKVTDMRYMFSGATSMNSPLSGWDTSSVINMAQMFYKASSFNQPLNNWNTGNVTGMTQMFKDASSFNQPLNNWNTGSAVNMHQMFYGTSMGQDLSSWNMSKVTLMGFMFTNPNYTAGLSKTNPMMLRMTYKCDVTTTGSLPLKNYDYNGTVTWGDGATYTYSYLTNPQKTLQAGVEYQVTAEGKLEGINATTTNATNLSKCLRSVEHIGENMTMSTMTSAFQGANKLTSVPDRIPGTITTANNAFKDATSFNDPNVKKWDVSKITDISSMFSNATSFNQDLSGWNTAMVTKGTTFAPLSFPDSYMPAKTSK